LLAFHSGFNLLAGILGLIFLEKMKNFILSQFPFHNKIEERHELEYESAALFQTPELSLLEAKKAIKVFIYKVRDMMSLTTQLLINVDQQMYDQIIQKLKVYEDHTDKMENDIANYLTKLLEEELSESTSEDTRRLITLITNLEQIADHILGLTTSLKKKHKRKTWLTPKQRNIILDLFQKTEELIYETEQQLFKDPPQNTGELLIKIDDLIRNKIVSIKNSPPEIQKEQDVYTVFIIFELITRIENIILRLKEIVLSYEK
jgi:phosphate:Na+ symporter